MDIQKNVEKLKSDKEKNVKKAFEMGCSVYCAKPVNVEKLTSAMKKLGVL